MAALERLSGRMLGHYAARCADRAELHDLECDADREWTPQPNDVYYSEIREGTLCKARHASDRTKWMLSIHYCDAYGIRTLTEGSRDHVERWALEAAAYGPPGGPEYHGQPRAWLRTSGDDTLHAVTIGGEFRAMPLLGGGHLLLFARNYGGLCVLGGGDLEQLQRTADERLRNFRGDALHVWIGDQRVLLATVAATTILGHLELFLGTKLVLGHLGGEYFGLQRVSGDDRECLRIYTMAQLRQGDLGQVLRWALGRQEHNANDGFQPATEQPPPPRPASQPTTEQPLPPQRPNSPPAPQPQRPARMAKLSAYGQELVDCHFTREEPLTGSGSTALPRIYEALRVLASLGMDNQLLWLSEVRRLMAEKAGIEFVCCLKTFRRALTAAKTPMVVRVGKRYLLRLGDLLLVNSELLREIAAVTPITRTARPSNPVHEQAPSPSPGPPPGAPATETHVPAAASRAATRSATSEMPGSAAASTAEAVPVHEGEPENTVDPPWIIAARMEARCAAATADGMPDDESEPGPPWLVSAGVRRPLTARTLSNGEPIIRTTLSSVGDGESASRSGGKAKIRGPPRG